ncbi:hypothetical protein BD413DRAFT_482581 [Trametes elegans]|nr:hypothetical protein BD413DRAFT_482581 [Trametes elegans]
MRLCRTLSSPRACSARRGIHLGTQETTTASPLPPTFRSLYRLFLRATAASVLAQPEATARLRKLWRPAFDHAVHIIRQMEDEKTPAARRDVLARWYSRWEARIDNTLTLLYSSAIARGMPHRVTQNLYRMIQSNQVLRDPSLPGKKPWRGQLPPDAPEYKVKPVKLLSPVQRELGQHFRCSPRILGEVVGMAEGWGGLSLGRTQRRR